MTTDPIANMLTQIRNGQAVLKPGVEVSFSNPKYKIAKILEDEGFVEKVLRKGRGPKRLIRIVLRYEDRKGAISGLKRISKPGQKIYLSAKELRPVRGGYGIAIISTSKGLMTDKQAKKKKLGGEIICEVW